MIIVGLLLFLTCAVAAYFAIGYVEHRRSKLERAVPTHVLEQSHDYYRLTRRMSHILEELLIHDDTVPVLTVEQRKAIEEVLKDSEKI